MNESNRYDILGIGGPILDQILRVSDAYLSTIFGKKGGMLPVDLETLEKIIADSGSEPVSLPGGCARNTLHGLARFGEKCAFLGMVGKDARGKIYKRLLEEESIVSLLIESETPTAIALALVTPDGERTMRTYQGASLETRGDHLDPHLFKQPKLVHLEGYTLFNDDLTESAMRLAKENGAKISFDLASFETVKKFKDHILYLLENYVDIVFANQKEVYALIGESDEAIAADFLGDLCEIGVVLMGSKGCFVKQGAIKLHAPAYPVEPLDTTGAGDLFESGFLHGYMRGCPVDICAHYGAIAGRAVVQVIGPIIPHEAWEDIFQQLKREF
jgi:sugar/nucleoside kinase (ribokinase family)